MNFPPRTFISLLAVTSASVLLVGCGSTSVVSLDYQPTGQTITGPRKIAAGRFIDHRRVGSYYLGSVKTPIGTTMEEITTRIPVEQVVRNAFAHGLSSRNMLTSQNSAEYIMTGEILDFSTDSLVRKGAYARIRVNLVREGSGQVVFSRVYEAERSGGGGLPGGGTVDALRELASRALQNTVDRALDDPSLRARLDGSSGIDRNRRIRNRSAYGPDVL